MEIIYKALLFGSEKHKGQLDDEEKDLLEVEEIVEDLK